MLPMYHKGSEPNAPAYNLKWFYFPTDQLLSGLTM